MPVSAASAHVVGTQPASDASTMGAPRPAAARLEAAARASCPATARTASTGAASGATPAGPRPLSLTGASPAPTRRTRSGPASATTAATAVTSGAGMLPASPSPVATIGTPLSAAQARIRDRPTCAATGRVSEVTQPTVTQVAARLASSWSASPRASIGSSNAPRWKMTAPTAGRVRRRRAPPMMAAAVPLPTAATRAVSPSCSQLTARKVVAAARRRSAPVAATMVAAVLRVGPSPRTASRGGRGGSSPAPLDLAQGPPSTCAGAASGCSHTGRGPAAGGGGGGSIGAPVGGGGWLAAWDVGTTGAPGVGVPPTISWRGDATHPVPPPPHLGGCVEDRGTNANGGTTARRPAHSMPCSRA